jgi:hypothetical protein
MGASQLNNTKPLPFTQAQAQAQAQARLLPGLGDASSASRVVNHLHTEASQPA